MASKVVQYVKDFAINASLILFFYFAIPWFFPDVIAQAILFCIVITITNIAAIMLSWNYFASTRCYDDEGNFVTMLGYKIMGASSTHFIVFVGRVVGNIGVILGLIYFPGLLAVDFYLFIYIKIVLLTISTLAALYTWEMINNIYSSATGLKYTCKDKSFICSHMKNPDPFFCDFPNNKDIEPEKVAKKEKPMKDQPIPSPVIGSRGGINALTDFLKGSDNGAIPEFRLRSKRDACPL